MLLEVQFPSRPRDPHPCHLYCAQESAWIPLSCPHYGERTVSKRSVSFLAGCEVNWNTPEAIFVDDPTTVQWLSGNDRLVVASTVKDQQHPALMTFEPQIKAARWWKACHPEPNKIAAHAMPTFLFTAPS